MNPARTDLVRICCSVCGLGPVHLWPDRVEYVGAEVRWVCPWCRAKAEGRKLPSP